MMIAGFGTFIPKIVESQFALTPAEAALILGIRIIITILNIKNILCAIRIFLLVRRLSSSMWMRRIFPWWIFN